MSFYNGTNGYAHPGDAGQLPPTSSTSSPASQQAQAQAQDGQGQPKPSGRQLSCALCQRRKIKCDRTTPCSNCVKANVVCTPSTPAPPRQRMRPRRDLQERLARCESLLRQYSEADRAVPSDVFSPMAMSASGASTPNGGLGVKTYQMHGGSEKKSPGATPGGRIVQESAISGPGGVRFVDGQFWEKLNDEITNMRSLIDSEDPEGAIPPYDHQKEFEQTSNCPSPQSDERPSLDPVQAFKLWQIFLDRVNPLIKIIHAPTLQPLLVQAATDITSVPLDYQALLYSIFGLASIALSNDEATSIIGCNRDQAAHRFTKATFHALTRFDFLRRYNMVVLQALVHNLIILQSQYNRHASWVLSGSLVRVAISMGYHRDGEALKLPPFETEMRRRIWWQIVNHDLTLTVDCGFKHISIPKDFDTKQPLNLNDADMYPDASGELKSREGPTEMAFILVVNRVTQYMLDEESRLTVESTILGQGPSDAPLDPYVLERNRLFIQSLERDLLEIEQRFLSPTAGNAHLAALGFRPHLIDRLNDMVRPMTEAPEWGNEVQGPKDNLFKLLLTTNENIGDAYLSMKEWGFGWFIRMHFHLEILATLSSFMYQKPLSNFADRSWRMFELFYREFPEIGNLDQRAYLAQAQFTLKAWDAREQAYHSSGSMLQVPDFIVQLRQQVQQHGTPAASGASRGPLNGAKGVDAQQQQGGVQMPQGMPMQDQPLSFMPEEQMGSNSLHSSFLSWDFAGDMGGMGALGDMNGVFGPYDDGSGGGPNPFQ